MSTESLAQRVEERVEFVTRVAQDLVANDILPDNAFIFRRKRIRVLVKGYFILSECYKNWRIHQGHNTEPPKIAAIAACAAMTFQVFEPVNRGEARSIFEARPNEMFAIFLAAAIVGIKVDTGEAKGRDFWYRVIDVLHEWPGETLEPFRLDINLSIDRQIEDYFRTVHEKDKLILNSLICIFELLGGKLSGEATPAVPVLGQV